jgi:hypothetical protein
MGTLAPRVVVVSRRSELDELLIRHGTRAAAGYFLGQRGRSLDEVTARHVALQNALSAVNEALPGDWRRGNVDRDDLSRFLFGPEDIVITVGQDGLVANVAKYLDGQPVIGVNAEPKRNPGVLARFGRRLPKGLLQRVAAGRAPTQSRTMVLATLDDGQQLTGLNEIYIGHSSHQSSRYMISVPQGGERHSSSGVVVGTGTGATGWCVSIAGERGRTADLPAPEDPRLCWFVREAWPSPATGVTMTAGLLGAGEELTVICESERLVAFADGVESDHLVMSWGQRIRVSLARQHLNLVLEA